MKWNTISRATADKNHQSLFQTVYLIEAEWRIYASVDWSIIVSRNVSSPVRCQAIIRTNAGLFWSHPWEQIGEIEEKRGQFLYKKIKMKISSVKWRPICLVLRVLLTVLARESLSEDRNTWDTGRSTLEEKQLRI